MSARKVRPADPRRQRAEGRGRRAEALAAWFLRLNPMHHYIGLCRSLLYDGVVPAPGRWLAPLGFSMAAFLLGFLLFCAGSQRAGNAV